MLVKIVITGIILMGVGLPLFAVEPDFDNAFTLSDEDLMALDVYRHENREPNDPNAPSVTAKRDIAGPGVEFDIYFPPENKNKTNIGLEYLSSEYRGKGSLAGIDVNGFNAFALKFTLVAVDGKSGVNEGGALMVGAVFDGAYKPECIDFRHADDAVCTTRISSNKISQIGFDVHKFTPAGWNPQGNTVTIRMEAAPNAQILSKKGRQDAN
jgi:hypothetical protein